MQDIRLVALDLDGTVFNDKKEITPRTLAAIRTACERGVAVLPATGRTASGVPEAFTAIPGVRYALTSNGASVVDLQTGEQLVNQPFKTEDALKIYDILAGGAGMMSIFIGGKSYTTRENAEQHMDMVPENLRTYFRTTRLEVADMHKTLRDHAHEIEKYSMLYATEAERDAAWHEVLAACPGMELTSSLPCNMEINAPGVTKGSGLMALARTLAHPRPVLVLDDPFSALDRSTEDTVFANLQEYAKDKVVFLISHRLYHFPQMQRVIFMEDGKTTVGTHEELLAAVSAYRQLYESQTGGQQHENEQ